MEVFIVILAKFLDPISIVLGVVAGIICNRISYVVVAGIGISLIVEAVLFNTQATRIFGQGLILGLPISILHCYCAYAIKNKVKYGSFVKN